MKETTIKRKKDRRVIRTEKAIRQAFRNLMIEKGAGKITVSALAREADIDRKTFYLHFSSIDELVQDEIRMLVERIAHAFSDSPDEEESNIAHKMRGVLLGLAEIANEDAELHQCVMRSFTVEQLVDALFEPVKTAVLENERYADLAGEKGFDYVLRFYIAGTLEVFCQWFTTDRETPIESIAEIIERLALQWK